MWSMSDVDLTNVGLVLEQFRTTPSKFEPTPYTFTKLENGKKTIADTNCFTPPMWLMLDHAIAVIWTLFSQKPLLHKLTIDDLKWTYEFLREIKNKKGENPPDVKVCLKEIQDRLIKLYSTSTSLKAEDFDEIAAAFGDKIISDVTSNYLTYSASKTETRNLCPSNSTIASMTQRQTPIKDVTKDGSSKAKKNSVNYENPSYPILEDDYESDTYEEAEEIADEEVEQYILSLMDEEKKQDQTPAKEAVKSSIPTVKRTGGGTLNMNSEQDTIGDGTNREKTTTKVHCVAEMRSLKYQKSTKVQDNGEEAAYSNLKAEIRRLTINRDQIMRFLKDWRSERVDKLHNELKRLNSIEEFLKNNICNEVVPGLRSRSPLNLKEIKTTESFSRSDKIFTNSFQNLKQYRRFHS